MLLSIFLRGTGWILKDIQNELNHQLVKGISVCNASVSIIYIHILKETFKHDARFSHQATPKTNPFQPTNRTETAKPHSFQSLRSGCHGRGVSPSGWHQVLVIFVETLIIAELKQLKIHLATVNFGYFIEIHSVALIPSVPLKACNGPTTFSYGVQDRSNIIKHLQSIHHNQQPSAYQLSPASPAKGGSHTRGKPCHCNFVRSSSYFVLPLSSFQVAATRQWRCWHVTHKLCTQ